MRDQRVRPGEAGFSVTVDADTETAREHVEAVIERALLAAGMRRLPPVRHLALVRETPPDRPTTGAAYRTQPDLFGEEA